jgi:hypothetical protein
MCTTFFHLNISLSLIVARLSVMLFHFVFVCVLLVLCKVSLNRFHDPLNTIPLRLGLIMGFRGDTRANLYIPVACYLTLSV